MTSLSSGQFKNFFNSLLSLQFAKLGSNVFSWSLILEKTLTLELNYKDYIYADQNKLKEWLIILLDNSLKYTEPKDSIKIKTYKKENRCIIEVIDTGIGISKQDQEHIFERFYRAEKSRAREKGGMGLGLSIAYNIVKLHKGTIKVDNKNIEKGTRMIVKLPIK